MIGPASSKNPQVLCVAYASVSDSDHMSQAPLFSPFFLLGLPRRTARYSRKGYLCFLILYILLFHLASVLETFVVQFRVRVWEASILESAVKQLVATRRLKTEKLTLIVLVAQIQQIILCFFKLRLVPFMKTSVSYQST